MAIISNEQHERYQRWARLTADLNAIYGAQCPYTATALIREQIDLVHRQIVTEACEPTTGNEEFVAERAADLRILYADLEVAARVQYGEMVVRRDWQEAESTERDIAIAEREAAA